MKVRMFGMVEAEGTELEMAAYTMMVLDCMKAMKEHEDMKTAEKEASVMEELLRIPIEELLKREQDGGEK